MKRTISATKEPNSVKAHPRALSSLQKRAKPVHGTGLLTAFQEIRELIVRGKLSPGTWLVEADLAEKLNLSRTPVRAALHWLQREGYVLEQRNVSKSRMIVAPLTKEDANELYRIIGHLEGLAGRGVAELPRKERMELAAQLREVNRQLLNIATGVGSHSADIFDLDRHFHRLIVTAGAGPRLSAMHQAIEPQTERYWRLYASSIINALRASVDEHKEIIAGVSKGDANKVESGLQKNWIHGAERLGHVIDMFGERGSW